MTWCTVCTREAHMCSRCTDTGILSVKSAIGTVTFVNATSMLLVYSEQLHTPQPYTVCVQWRQPLCTVRNVHMWLYSMCILYQLYMCVRLQYIDVFINLSIFFITSVFQGVVQMLCSCHCGAVCKRNWGICWILLYSTCCSIRLVNTLGTRGIFSGWRLVQMLLLNEVNSKQWKIVYRSCADR